jgi:hypothetical protein
MRRSEAALRKMEEQLDRIVAERDRLSREAAAASGGGGAGASKRGGGRKDKDKGTDREALLGDDDGADEEAGASGAGGGKGLSSGAMVQMNRAKMEEQDKMVEGIGQTAGLLSEIGKTIGTKVGDSMTIMGELDSSVESGNTGLRRETARIELTQQQQPSCWLYVAIFLLLALLIFLTVKAPRWGQKP